MHPPQTENLLFGGIPPQGNRGFTKLAASICLHVVVIGLLAFTTPAILVNRPTNLRAYAPLIAPPERTEIPKPAPPPPVAVVRRAPEPPVTREFAIPVRPRALVPKLEAPPELVKARRPELVLPTPLPVEPIQPPVQTGLFGANATARPNPVLPVPAARSAGFDTGTRQTTITAVSAATSVGGFDPRTGEARPVSGTARVQTGAFTPAARNGEVPATTPAVNVTHAGFDVRAAKPQPDGADSAVRKTGFDEVKTMAAPVPAAAKTTGSARPVEIIDKPRPAYTAEARAQRVEGDVLLDVIFTAGGEVRVLSVKRGLGHGLDENAMEAARHIRFHPATAGGKPVDQRAVVHIIFQITG